MPVFAATTIKNLLSGESSLAEYYSEQFEHLTPATVLIALLLGLAMGVLIAFTYRMCYRGVLYSPNFALTLILLTVVTTPVVMCIKSDIALSMGMVGALSIVRFRTAVKEPMDTAYMFWALTMGILLGTELFFVAGTVALGISAILFLLTFLRREPGNTYLLVLHYDEAAEADITSRLQRTVRHQRLRSKTVTRESSEMTVEVRLERRQDLVADMLNIEGVYDATLVSCQIEAGT